MSDRATLTIQVGDVVWLSTLVTDPAKHRRLEEMGAFEGGLGDLAMKQVMPSPKAFRVTEIVEEKYIIARRGTRKQTKAFRVSMDAIVGWSKSWYGYRQIQPTPDHATKIRGLDRAGDLPAKAKRKRSRHTREINL